MAKILIVEDSRSILEQIVVILKSAGHSVITAIDGQDGVEKAKSEDGLDLVISDYNMPKMNGIEMLEQIKHHGYIADHIPTIMLTTERVNSHLLEAHSAKVTGWLLKPVSKSILVKAVDKVILGIKKAS